MRRSVIRLLTAIMTCSIMGGCDKPPVDEIQAAPAPAPTQTPAQAPTQTPAQTAAPTPASTPDPVPVAPAPAPVVEDVPPAPVTMGPRIRFDEEVISFGTIWDVGSQTCSFTFTNTGDETLEIKDIKASCGCTTTTLQQRTFEPGEGSSIDVVFKPKGRGHQQKSIAVVTNSPYTPTVRLAVAAEITEFVTVDPLYLRLGTIPLGQRGGGEVTLTSADPNFRISRLQAGQRFINARVVHDNTQGPFLPGQEPTSAIYTVAVEINENAPWGTFFSYVDVRVAGTLTDTGEEISHTAKINVSGAVYGELHADGGMFRIDVVAPGESFERTIRLWRPSGEPFTITEGRANTAAPTMPEVDLEIIPITDPDITGYDIILSGDSGDFLGAIRGLVTIRTDVPGEDRLTFDFAGMIRKRGPKERH